MCMHPFWRYFDMLEEKRPQDKNCDGKKSEEKVLTCTSGC